MEKGQDSLRTSLLTKRKALPKYPPPATILLTQTKPIIRVDQQLIAQLWEKWNLVSDIESPSDGTLVLFTRQKELELLLGTSSRVSAIWGWVSELYKCGLTSYWVKNIITYRPQPYGNDLTFLPHFSHWCICNYWSD